MWRERRVIALSRFRGRPYWTGTAFWIVYFSAPLIPGWLISRSFDALQQGDNGRLVALAVALVVGEALVATFILIGHRWYMLGMQASMGLAQANVMHAQVVSGGPEAASRDVPVGDALARLRDDPLDVMNLADSWVDLGGSLLYGTAVTVALASIDPLAALAAIGPLFLLGLANSVVGRAARSIQARARAATSEANEFLTAAFAASLSVKLAGAQPQVLDRLASLNRKRASAMVRRQVFDDSLFRVNGTLTDVCVGLGLLVAARGRLGAGDVALFASYLVNLQWLPLRLGGIIVGRRRFDVAAGRLDALVASREAHGVDQLTVRRDLPVLREATRAVAGPPAHPSHPLERLDLVELTVAARGLHGVSASLARGTLTVVAGPVGSGKTSLLRAVVGLLPLDSGEVRWNGETVADLAAFMVPPRCAYVAQVPRLFAESLADNLRLGTDRDDDALWEAVRLAAFDGDVAGFPEGLATLIGSRGVRLSGGQSQRAAAARALVHRPDLLVLDDLASALDVETEHALWDRLAAAGFTILTASNRAAALSRADQVIEF